jgi:tubulin beta
MGTEFQEVLCDEHGIGGGGKYCGGNHAQLGRMNVFYYEASGGKYVPCAMFFDLESDVIDAARASPLGDLVRPGNHANHTRGQNWAKDHYRKVDTIFLTPHYTSVKHLFSLTPPLRLAVSRRFK